MDELETLEQLGLTRAQSIIYKTLLNTGSTKIGKIIEETNLQSSVVHNNINKLIEKGIVNFIQVGKVKHYNAAEPQTLRILIEEDEEKIQRKKEHLDSILPKLKKVKAMQKKQEVEVYKGKKGLHTAFREEYDKVKHDGEIKFISLPSEYHKHMEMGPELTQFFIKINNQLLEKNCRIHGIGHKSLEKVWNKVYKDKRYSFRYTDLDSPFDISIFKDTILLSVWGEQPIVIRIEDKEFVSQTNRYFKELWERY